MPLHMKEGIRQAELDALYDWPAHRATYSADQCAVTALCDRMTGDIHAPAEAMAAVVGAMGQRKAVKMTAPIAAHNMVSRFLEAIQFHSTDER